MNFEEAVGGFSYAHPLAGDFGVYICEQLGLNPDNSILDIKIELPVDNVMKLIVTYKLEPKTLAEFLSNFKGLE